MSPWFSLHIKWFLSIHADRWSSVGWWVRCKGSVELSVCGMLRHLGRKCSKQQSMLSKLVPSDMNWLWADQTLAQLDGVMPWLFHDAMCALPSPSHRLRACNCARPATSTSMQSPSIVPNFDQTTHVCIHVYIYICIYVCMYVCMYVGMYVCMYVHTYVCMYVCTYVRMYVCMFVCLFVCMFVCLFMYVYVFLCVFMYIYASIKCIYYMYLLYV